MFKYNIFYENKTKITRIWQKLMLHPLVSVNIVLELNTLIHEKNCSHQSWYVVHSHKMIQQVQVLVKEAVSVKFDVKVIWSTGNRARH